MFERFSGDAVDVLIAAQVEARRLHRDEIGTDHLLLGVVSIRRALTELVPGQPAPLLTRARAAAVRGSAVQNGRVIPYASDAWQVIQDASQLAGLAAARTEPEHFLLALLRQQQETAAMRLLAALHVDREALARWCTHSLAERSQAPANNATGGSADNRRDNPLLVPSWPRRIQAFYSPWLWGGSMDVPRRWHRTWFLAACFISLCYTVWAIAVYRSGQLAGIERGAWYAALLIALMLSFGAVAYWSGKGLGAMAEGWKAAGAANGCLVVLGYLTVGLLPLALATGGALGLAMVVFGTERVTFLLSNLGSVAISTQQEWLILTPMGLSVAIFALYSPFWHYSLAAPLITLRRLGKSFDRLPEDEELLPEFDRLCSNLRNRTYTAFGADFFEQYVSRIRAEMLIILYQFSARDSYLEEALAIVRVAADVCLRNPRLARDYLHADLMLGGLAEALWAVYQARPDEEALRDAIWAREQLAGARLLSRSSRLENAHKLARLHIALYELTGDPKDLGRGRKVAGWTAEAARPGTGSAAVLLTLGLAEELCFDSQLAVPEGESVARNLSDTALSALSAAEAAYQAGADQGGEDNDAGECRYRLALLLARQSRLTGDVSGQQAALGILRKMVGEPDDDSGNYREDLPPEQRARFMIGLADVLTFAAADDPTENETLALYKAAAAIIEAPAIVRLEAACGWGYHTSEPADAAAGLELAVELLMMAASPGLGYDATRRQLGRWPELPVDAAAAQLQIGRPERAVELLEHGRTVMWSRRTALWDAPLDQIGAADPSMREQLTAIRSELISNVLSSSGRRDTGRQNVAAERRASLTREWNRIMHEMGFGHPASFAELKAAADGGPVVLLNASRLRSDALILCQGQPLGHLCLPGDIYTKARAVIEAGVKVTLAQDAVTSFRDPSAASAAKLPAVIDAENQLRYAEMHYSLLSHQMLTEWLWSDVTEPTLYWLAKRGKLTGKDSNMPRLWWCPTGGFTFFPLHAAGSQNLPTDSVMDQVISSYTPNLAQLIRARALIPEESRQILILAPDNELPYAPNEAALVASCFSNDDVLLASGADAESCLREISRSAVLHFVGHGKAPGLQKGPNGSPSAGGLMIGPPGDPSFLSARDLAVLPQATARFAYLSVCESATPDNLIPDEATNPAAVLHFGGFPNVIATLRPIPDRSGLSVATNVYTALVRGGVLDGRQSARALHDALHSLRREEPGSTASWTTYMHIGP